jgi:hypothetical protein
MERILFVSVDPDKVESVTYDGKPMEKVGEGFYRRDDSNETCEWVPCKDDAKYLEASGDGRLVHLCLKHRRLLRKQKQIYYGS